MGKSKKLDRQFELKWLDPKTLKPNPSNWRSHPAEQTKLLDAVLGEVGWAGVALFNETTGHLIDRCYHVVDCRPECHCRPQRPPHDEREWAIGELSDDLTVPDCDGSVNDDQPRMDEKETVICPKCGYEFE